MQAVIYALFVCLFLVHAEAEELVPCVPQSRSDSSNLLRSTRQHSLLLSCGKDLDGSRICEIWFWML